jgi:hypothetical protein
LRRGFGPAADPVQAIPAALYGICPSAATAELAVFVLEAAEAELDVELRRLGASTLRRFAGKSGSNCLAGAGPVLNVFNV